MKESKEYIAKGQITFMMTSTDETCGYAYLEQTEDKLIKECAGSIDSPEVLDFIREDIRKKLTVNDPHILSGEEFLDYVKSGSIIDYDGTLSHIFVDGMISNLGLCAGGLCQGAFLVDANTFTDICKEHKVEVDWANK